MSWAWWTASNTSNAIVNATCNATECVSRFVTNNVTLSSKELIEQNVTNTNTVCGLVAIIAGLFFVYFLISALNFGNFGPSIILGRREDRRVDIIIPFKFIDSETFMHNKSKRYVGCEIECFSKGKWFTQDEMGNKYYNLQGYDNSLESIHGDPVEFRSLPINGDRLIEHTKMFCDELKNRGFFTNRTCGLHIHIGMKDKIEDLDMLKKMYLFYSKFEREFLNIVPRSRRKNEYCCSFSKIYGLHQHREKIFNDVKNCDNFKSFLYEKENWGYEFGKEFKDEGKRYCWLNMHSMFCKRGTVEIRLHEGTIDGAEITNWMRLHLEIIRMLEKHSVDWVLRLNNDSKTFVSLFHNDIKKYINQRRIMFS